MQDNVKTPVVYRQELHEHTDVWIGGADFSGTISEFLPQRHLAWTENGMLNQSQAIRWDEVGLGCKLMDIARATLWAAALGCVGSLSH